MPLAKLITPKSINLLWRLSPKLELRKTIGQAAFCILLTAFFLPAFSQDNSPYTRYGLGDIVPSTNINSRGMAGLSAGYNDLLSINLNNPASYGSFQAVRELKSKKLLYGRAILDLGLNFESRTLIEPGRTDKFTASNALFSHLQVGVPLKTNWGLSFGLRPLSRISYKISNNRRLYDEITGLPIDSVVSMNEGDGGAYLASAGVGHRIFIGDNQSLSLGFSGGYLFGKNDYSSRIAFLNDTVEYKSGNFQSKTTYGNIYFTGGLQYQVRLDSTTFFTFGGYGNLRHKLNASRDVIRETYVYSESNGNMRLDSVYDSNDNKGKIEYPSSFTVGFTIQRIPNLKKGGWLIGIDYHQANWQEFRFYGGKDSTRKKWELRVGGELRPSLSAARKSYFGNVAYRAGLFFGPDYVKVKSKLPVMGASLGFGLPILSQNRFSPGQATMINIAFEYIKRGNNDNLLKENMFRVSVGFSLSDFWFGKKKYD